MATLEMMQLQAEISLLVKLDWIILPADYKNYSQFLLAKLSVDLLEMQLSIAETSQAVQFLVLI